MPAIASRLKSASVQFWMLAAFLVVVFLTGGASRVDEQPLLLLRPLSAIICAVALLTLKREHLAPNKWLLAGFASIILLCILYLIPLPPSLWHSLPGRAILVDVDRLAGLGEVWRPLTMTPMNGWHALASLATPLAVLLLGVQLGKEDLYRLLPLLLGLAGFSGLIGIFQVIGDPSGPLYIYRVTNNGAAVGLFANRNHAAVLLVWLFPILAVFASISSGDADRQRMRQFAAIAGAIVLVPLILVTGSRAGLLLSLPALIAAALLYRKPEQGRIVRRGESGFKLQAWHFVATAAVISLLFLTIIFSRAEAVDRLFRQSTTESGRADFWEVGVGMMWKYFPFGSGIGSIVEAFQIDEPRRYLDPNYLNHLHNDWLEIPVTGGLPATLILLVAIAFYLLRTTRLWRRRGNDQRALEVARLASVLIAILALASIGDYPLRTPIMMAVFAVLCLWFTAPALAERGRAGQTGMARGKKENPILGAVKRIGLMRLLIGLILAVAGGSLSFALAASGVARNTSPQAALIFMPNESDALATRADQIFFADPDNVSPSIAKLARRALVQQGLNARAVRLLGYAADAKGDSKSALALIEMAARLSRRDAGAQLWLVEHYAQANDTLKTLDHYDLLLTTKPTSEALLFPRLSNAIEDTPIRQALLPYMRQNKPWIGGFLWHAINNDKDLSNVVNLIIEAKGFPKNKPKDETSRTQERSLMSRLVNENRFDDAHRIYRLVPGMNPARLTNPAFDESDRDARYGAMGWQIPDDPNAGGGFTGQKEEKPKLSVFANSATTQTVATRLLYLQPGSYRFTAKLSQLERGEGGYLLFQLRCPTSGTPTPIWYFEIDPKRTTASLNVPANCPVQFLDIVASGGKGQLGMEATVSSVAITQ